MVYKFFEIPGGRTHLYINRRRYYPSVTRCQPVKNHLFPSSMPIIWEHENEVQYIITNFGWWKKYINSRRKLVERFLKYWYTFCIWLTNDDNLRSRIRSRWQMNFLTSLRKKPENSFRIRTIAMPPSMIRIKKWYWIFQDDRKLSAYDSWNRKQSTLQ